MVVQRTFSEDQRKCRQHLECLMVTLVFVSTALFQQIFWTGDLQRRRRLEHAERLLHLPRLHLQEVRLENGHQEISEIRCAPLFRQTAFPVHVSRRDSRQLVRREVRTEEGGRDDDNDDQDQHRHQDGGNCHGDELLKKKRFKMIFHALNYFKLTYFCWNIMVHNWVNLMSTFKRTLTIRKIYELK